MDIVNRLKQFMNEKDIAVTQFADNCGIPRPSLSQLLNGRNKKISDDVFRRIHAAYPSLSVMWLMFGEGNMFQDGQETEETSNSEAQVSNETGSIIMSDDLSFGFEEGISSVDSSQSDSNDDENISSGRQIISIDFGTSDHTGQEIIQDDSVTTTEQRSEQIVNDITSGSSKEGGKKIAKIIVYYDDNTYEAFSPK